LELGLAIFATPAKFNNSPLSEKGPFQDKKIVFQSSFFKGFVKFRGCKMLENYIYFMLLLGKMTEHESIQVVDDYFSTLPVI